MEQPPPPGPAGKKKRAYAGQAYEFGVGGNAGAGGPQPVGQDHPASPAPYGGGYQQPGYAPAGGVAPVGYGADAGAAPLASPGYGVPPQPAAVGGYQAPDQGYPAPPGTPGVPGVAGMSGLNNQFGQMGLGSQPQAIPHQAAPQHSVRMNQLYPTDLMSQPFNVTELDLPPPPLVLPPNVSDPSCYPDTTGKRAAAN